MRQIVILGLCLCLSACVHQPTQLEGNDLIVPPEIDLLPNSDNLDIPPSGANILNN